MTKYRRKKGTRKPKRKSTVRKVQMSRAVVPTSHTVKLKYCQQIELDSYYGQVSSFIFRANSCYDPSYSSAGHQPLGYDEWCKFYGKYEVMSSQIQCKFLSTQDNSAAAHVIACDLRPDANNIIDIFQLIEASKASWKINNNHAPSSLSKAYSNRFWGDKASDKREAFVTVNPQDMAYFHVLTCGNSSNEDPPPIRVLVCITYVVKFTEPQNLRAS